MNQNSPLPPLRFVQPCGVRALQIALSRKRTVHVRPPAFCELEISLQGVKLIMSLEDEYDTLDEVWADVLTQTYIQSFASLLLSCSPLVRQM